MAYRVLTTAILSASVVGLVSVSTASAAVAEDLFKDKTMTVVVPSGSGGTFHIYSIASSSNGIWAAIFQEIRK